MTLLTPVNGRVSDIVGRKPMLYAAIVVFTVFSALCGAAQNIEWLIVCRALQGLGGGTIMGLVSIIVSDIVPLEKRGSYQGFMGASWGVAAVVGPILGGAFTHMSRSGWRWCFYINLPTAGVAFILLVLYLKLNKPRNHTFDELRRTFDFAGLFLIMVGSALLIVGFSFAADHGFQYAPSIALIVVGGVMFCAAIANCLVTKRVAVIPAVSSSVSRADPSASSGPAQPSSTPSRALCTPPRSFRATSSSRSSSRACTAPTRCRRASSSCRLPFSSRGPRSWRGRSRAGCASSAP